MTVHRIKTGTRKKSVDRTIDILYTLVTLRLSSAVARWIEYELTFAQLKALLVLSRRGEASLGELANALGTGKSAASILVQQLVTRGLVDRAEDRGDRRRSVLRLTDSGARLVAGRRKEREEEMHRWLSPLSDVELAGLERGLNILLDAMQAELHRGDRMRTAP